MYMIVSKRLYSAGRLLSCRVPHFQTIYRLNVISLHWHVHYFLLVYYFWWIKLGGVEKVPCWVLAKWQTLHTLLSIVYLVETIDFCLVPLWIHIIIYIIFNFRVKKKIPVKNTPSDRVQKQLESFAVIE